MDSPNPNPATRAETSAGLETSSAADVDRFLDQIAGPANPVRRTLLGRSAGGRPIPLIVAGHRLPEDGNDAHRQGRLVVAVQANIHGGEVEGKEAVLAWLRDLLRSDPNRLLHRAVLLVVPVLNPDGNDAWGDFRRNRPHQDGPTRIGERPNSLGLDLNRDHVKLETPEISAVVREIHRRWDPDVFLDLHTTNGTRHGFDHTDAPPTHPNTPPAVLEWCRDHLLPRVRRRLRRENGWECFDYGNTERVEGRRAWATFGEEARYATNYAGLRGTAGLLSEAVSFRPFPFRIATTRAWMETVLAESLADSDRLRAARTAVSRPKELGVRFALDSAGHAVVPLEDPGFASSDPSTAPTVLTAERLPVYDRWKPVRSAAVPAAWLIPAAAGETLGLLRRHGVRMERLERAWSGSVSQFRIRELVSGNPFQGRRLARLEGEFQTVRADIPAGMFVVPFDQPLGRLAFTLLEPESLDGAAAWGFLDRFLAPGGVFPVAKAMEVPGRNG